MNANTLQVVINSEARLNGFRSAMGALDNMVGRVLGLNGFLQGLRGHLAGVLSIGALRSAYLEAVRSGQAYAQLARSISGSGQASRGALEDLKRQAAALQQLTGVEDEQIAAVQGLLLSYGGTIAQVKQLTPLVLDLAARMGMDARSAARLLGQALDGQSVSLGRLNLTAKTFDGLIQQLRPRVAGQAAALHQAAGGAGALRVAMGEANKALGFLIAPYVDDGLRKITSGLERATTFLQQAKPLLSTMVESMQTVAVMLGALALTKIPALFASIAAGIPVIAAALAANPAAAATLMALFPVFMATQEGVGAYSARGQRSAAADRLAQIQARMQERFGTTSAEELRRRREAGEFGVATKPVDPAAIKLQSETLAAAREDLLKILPAQERLNLLRKEQLDIERALSAESDPLKHQQWVQKWQEVAAKIRSTKRPSTDFDMSAPRHSESSRRGLFGSAADWRVWTSQLNVSKAMLEELKAIRTKLGDGIAVEI